MKLQKARGVRDFSFEEKIRRNDIADKLRSVFEKNGFSPIETPVLERFDVLSAKYAGGDEILKETFRLKDQGNRNLGLRYDLTVPLCRYIGMNPSVKFPFKRYQIERVFRDGPIKLGRYREFWQCDIDIIGVKGMLAEMQCIEVASSVFEETGIDVDIRINNRKILNGIMKDIGISDKADDVILSIDKLQKIGKKEVRKEIISKGVDEDKADSIFEYITRESFEDMDIKDEEGKQGLKEIKELFSYLSSINIKPVFDPSLARGLNYYNGTIFEVFLKNSDIKSACAAGGRYDNLISNFLGSKKDFPSVGISFGLDVLSDAIKNKGRKTKTDVFIIPINTTSECIRIARELRKDINVDLDIMGRGITKNLQYADSMGIMYCLIVGEDELKAGKYKLKNLESGDEENMRLEDIPPKVLK